MPKKINFHLVHASSEDDDHRAIQLNVHSPSTKGWQSVRFCLYPQDIIIQLDHRAKIRKIQILSHQFLIATKIEFFVGQVEDELAEQWQDAVFHRLGYVDMTSNEKTNYTARELKSVHVDVTGSFVKLIIHKNHINRLNMFNQVGIIAVNIIGIDGLDEQDYPQNGLSRDDDDDNQLTLPDVLNRSEYISPMDDLAFDLYQDPEIAKIIRQLEKRKREAVLQENFEDAKKLKTCIQELQQVGQKLSKLEVEKRRAVEEEDYDTAAKKKSQMEEYRQEVYRQILTDDLLKLDNKISPRLSEQLESVSRQRTPPRYSELPKVSTPVISPKHPLPHPSSLGQKVAYEDRVLPAIVHRTQNLDRSESQLTTTPRTFFSEHPNNYTRENTTLDENNEDGVLNPDEPESLNSRDERTAQELVDVFGLSLATKAFSKSWSRREEAILEALNRMKELDSSSENAFSMMHACVILVNRAVKDKVSGVFNAGLHLLKMILTEYISKHNIQRSESHLFLERILPNLILKTGDTNQRQRDVTKDFIVEASQFKDVKPLQTVVHESVVPVKPSTPARLAISRTEIVESLFKVHKLKNGLTLENIMKFANAALSHNSGEVRQKAESLIVALYGDVGAPVRSYLPTDGEKTRKNVIYKQLFVAFDGIDGKPFQEQTTTTPNITIEKKTIEKTTNDKKTNDRKTIDRKTSKLPTKKPTHAASGSDATLLDPTFEKTCIFCGEQSEKFTPDGLDLHYWKSCPMLIRCTHCKTTLEISELTKHLLVECESNDLYSRCPRCTEAIPKQHYRTHVSQKTCHVAESGKNRCPLCHTNITGTEESWKPHLMGRDGCKENPRRMMDRSYSRQGKLASRTGKL